MRPLTAILFRAGPACLLGMVTTLRFPGLLVYDPPLPVRLALGGAAFAFWCAWVLVNRQERRNP